MSQTISELLQQKQVLLKELSELSDFRPGSLVGRYRKCGKPYCHCANDGDRGHGPSWSLTRSIGGKTVTKIIPKEAVEQTQKQLSEYQRFTELGHKLTELNIEICDEHLNETKHADNSQEAEKGGS